MGPETSDDAGVYRIGPECALVETADIITPLVDNPFDFGRIAAANAVSDVYAMGARPVTAMNLVFFPSCFLGPDVLRRIMDGGQSVLDECGVCLVGGHTVDDDELKYGLSVTGLIAPGRVIRNSGARPGDRLILTKPLGSGIISTAIKGEMASAAAISEATGWMTTLNRVASELMIACNAHAATDITGFGLIGHATEMARGAGLTLRFELDSLPLMTAVPELVADGMVPAGCYRNRDHYLPMVHCSTQVNEAVLLPLFDPQTSGGLLIALTPDEADRFLVKAGMHGLFTRKVGEVTEFRGCPVELF